MDNMNTLTEAIEVDRFGCWGDGVGKVGWGTIG